MLRQLGQQASASLRSWAFPTAECEAKEDATMKGMLDPERLERAAKAVRDIDKSPNAKLVRLENVNSNAPMCPQPLMQLLAVSCGYVLFACALIQPTVFHACRSCEAGTHRGPNVVGTNIWYPPPIYMYNKSPHMRYRARRSLVQRCMNLDCISIALLAVY